MSDNASKQLRAAWDEMIETLQRARDGIDEPSYMPAREMTATSPRATAT